METLLCWLKNNLLELLVAGGTLGATYFAYRSSKMSEMATKAQFSPLIAPIYFRYIPTGGNNGNTTQKLNGERILTPSFIDFAIENRSEHKNAFAKNVRVSINSNELLLKDWKLEEESLETINPGPDGRVDFRKINIKINDFIPSTIRITYKDILGNEFETTCRLIKNNEYTKKIDYSWEYKQK